MTDNEKIRGASKFLKKFVSLFRKSIFTQLLVLMVIFAIIPTLVSSTIFYKQLTDQYQVKEENAIRTTNYMNEHITVVFNQYKSQVNFITSIKTTSLLLEFVHSSSFNDYMNQWSSTDLTNGSLYVKYLKTTNTTQASYASLLSIITEINTFNHDIDAIRVFGSTGNIVVGVYQGTELTSNYEGDSYWFKEAMNQSRVPTSTVYFTSVTRGSFSDTPTLKVIMPLDNTSSTVTRLGFVVIDFNLSIINEVLRSSQRNYATLFVDLNYENEQGGYIGPVVIFSERYPSLVLNTERPLTELSGKTFKGSGKITFEFNGVKTNYYYEVNDILNGVSYSRHFLIGLEIPLAESIPNVSQVSTEVALVLVVTIAIAIILSYLFARSFNSIRDSLKEISKDLSEGRLYTLKAKKLTMREDELKELGELFEEIRLSLIESTKPTKEATVLMSGYMEQLALAASELDRSSSEISSSFKEIADGMNLQASRNNEVIELISSHAELVTRALDQASEILEVLRDIIEETTFIALNAQIEAARAGAMGRGFMVVASSIRELAAKGKERLKEVNITMNQIRSNLEASVKRIIKNTEDLSTTTEEIAAISEESFSNLLDEVELLKEMTVLINRINEMAKDINQKIQKYKTEPEDEKE